MKIAIWLNWCLGQLYHSGIEVLQIAQLLELVSFGSVYLVRENLRGLRENLKHKIPTQNGAPLVSIETEFGRCEHHSFFVQIGTSHFEFTHMGVQGVQVKPHRT